MPTNAELFAKYKNPAFVETGSFTGNGIQAAIDSGFGNVHSIELSEYYHSYCKSRFVNEPKVKLHLGDSSKILWSVISSIQTPITFWLDGHYSGDNTALGDKYSPLMEELDIIANHPIKTHTIIIDDIRLWNVNYPDYKFGLKEIKEKLKHINQNYTFRIEDSTAFNKDILVAVSNVHAVISAPEPTKKLGFAQYKMDQMKILFYCGIHNLVNFSRIRPYYDICYGFDANPDKVEHARKVYQNDPNVKIIHGALTEKSGEVIDFIITTNWDPASSMGNPNPEFIHMKTGLLAAQKTIKVPTINLYYFCISNDINRIDTLITDLQGMDLTVLQTLMKFIQQGKIREIQCEVEPDNTPPRYLEIPPSKFNEFTQLLSDKYDVLWVDPVNHQQAEVAWEMDVRWRVKGGRPFDDIEFIMENELLVAKVGPNSPLATYSQYREDIVINALFSYRSQGFYVDVGANDPDVGSNTKLFYNKGWCGINIEPEPSLHAKLCAKRDRDINLNIGAGPESGVMTFYRMSADTLSSFNKEAAIQAGKLWGGTLVSEEPLPIMKLADILAANLKGTEVDYLSVDAEGYDLAVLKSNDWLRYRPSVIIVEINVGGDEIIQFLQESNYILIFNNGTNGIFVSRKFLDTIDDGVRENLVKLEQLHNLETFFPCSDVKNNIVVNFVYGHMRQEDTRAVHRGNISIIWSSNPIEECDVYVYQNASSYKGKRGGIDILVTLEPVVVLPGEFDERVWKHFDYVLTLFDSLTERGKKFRKIFFPHFGGISNAMLTEDIEERRRLYPTHGRRNAVCMINGYKKSSIPSELYSARSAIARWFHDNSDIAFDVFGTPPFPLPNYKGALAPDAKLTTLKQYRYCLCFENTNHPNLSTGYITEKILDCLETRTIPIYLGASNVEKYIPLECFIDFRKFKDYRDLDNYLHSISENNYQKYIDNIDAFVCHKKLRKFSMSALYDDVVKILVEHKLLDPLNFKSDTSWLPGISPSVRRKEWKTSNVPTMWTWKYLSMADSSRLQEGYPATHSDNVSLLKTISKKEKNADILKKNHLKVLYVGLRYNYGNARRGIDYGSLNILDALKRFKNIQTDLFDFVTDSQLKGVAGMSYHLLDTIKKGEYDVLFYISYDLHADVLHEVMSYITDHTKTTTVIWMSDDHWRFENYSRFWVPCADYIITTTNEAVSKYRQAGFDRKVIKSQWAFNPFTYEQIQIARTRDVSFVGMAHGNRPEIIQKLRRSGLRIDVFGWGWSENVDIPFRDMVRIFCQSKINLNLSNSSTITTQQIKGRNFEVPGCRGFLITTPAENLEDYYEPDKEVVIASSMEELIDKSKYYLTHERERESIAQRGYERTLAEHTWTHRLVDIFKHIGFSATAQLLPQVSPSPFLHRTTPLFAGALTSADTMPPLIIPENNDNILTSIIVIAYNQLHYTKLCLESILHYTAGSYELILLDNGSIDGTSEYFESVRKFHPHTRIIRSFQNRIAESILNYVVSIAYGKYIIFVTNDTMVHEGWLENFIRQIESAPNIGIAGPRSNNISGPQFASVEYDTLEAYQTFAAEWCKQHRGENFLVERMVGMLTIMKKDFLERVGGLDPDLPANGRDGGYGFSDDDISLRFLLAGYKLLVANDVFIHHFGSMTARQHRPDLFGAPQNINKEKYIKKLQRNDRVTIGPRGELTLKPYNLDEPIPVAENTVIRSPRICIVETDSGVAEATGHPLSYAALANSYHGAVVSPGSDSRQPLLTQTITGGEYDFNVVVDKRIAPSPEKVRTLIDTALCYPDVAVMVPIGNFAPSTHAGRTANGNEVEIIQYADMSFCVINVKIIRPFIQGLAQSGNDEEFFWFLQRRVRGEGYFIAKANNIIADADVPCTSHPYDSHPLPEQWVQEKKYAEAIAVYKDDLIKDPTFVESLYQLAYIAKEQHQSSEAIQYAQDALQTDPHHIQSLIFLSRIFLEQGNLKRAESFVRLSNLKQPGNPEVQKIVELYEAQLKGQAGLFQADAVKEIPSLMHPEFIKGLTSIIILTQNRLDLTKKCVKSIRKYTPEPHEIIFVDNGSTDGTVKWLQGQVKDNKNCRLIENKEAVGLAKGRNQGINLSQGEFILLLDKDVIVSNGWLSGMLECLNRAPAAGIAGPMTNNSSGLQQVMDDSYRSVDYLDKYAAKFKEHYRHRQIPYRNIAGFCMLFKRTLPEKIGMLDERFVTGNFMDEDFCIRASLENYRNYIAGDVFVHHHGGKDSPGDRNILEEKWVLNITSPEGKKLAVLKTTELADDLYQKGKIDQAVEALINCIKITPEAKEIYYELARIFIESRRYSAAWEVIGSMPETVKNELKGLEYAGYAKEGLGLYDEAAEYAERMLTITPTPTLPRQGGGSIIGNCPAALNLKGILAFKKGEKEKALECFQKAIAIDPGCPDASTNLGAFYWSMDKKDEALAHLRRGFILSPTVPGTNLIYYSVVSSLGIFSDAEADCLEACRLYPNNKNLAFLYIDTLIQQGKFDSAMPKIEDALAMFGLDEGILAAALSVREKLGPRVPGKKGSKKATLSVCMIVKNEEEHLVKCLKSVRDVVDEMIVVDTGSTDKTIDIARIFGAQVFEYPWTGDFSEARNHSLAQATCDWILVLDADEVISSLDHKRLLKTIDRGKQRPVAFEIDTRNYLAKSGAAGWTENDGTYPQEEKGIGWAGSNKVRLFRNSSLVRFENPVHELVEASLGRAGILIEKCSIPIHHYGRLNQANILAKGRDYYLLGRRKLEERGGGDFVALRELAVQAGELGMSNEAVDVWQQALVLRPDDANALFNLSYHYMQIGKYQEALQAAKRSVELSPAVRDAVLNYALCEMFLGNVLKTTALIEECVSSGNENITLQAVLGVAYCVGGHTDKGLAILKKLARRPVNNVPYYVNSLVGQLIASGQIEYARLLIESALSGNIADQQTLLLRDDPRLKQNSSTTP